ncbi:MAG TPA: SGNH hydrolase domain-containing protein, partial [Verrucomicrobiae bacterium]|nr:SGNH hydrolase domain-containing protein [Verrucomicrobiae bacterium]
AVLHVLNVVCAKEGVRGVAATHSATIPLLEFPCSTRYSLRGDSIAYNQEIVKFVREQKVKNVLLAAAWNGYISSTSTQLEKDRFNSCLTETIDALHKAGAKVFIMEDVPKQKFNVPRMLAVAVRFGKDPSKLGLPVMDERLRTAWINKTFDRFAGASVVLLDPASILTDQSGICRAEMDGKALYFDQQHLTIFGEMQLQPMFDQMIRQEIVPRSKTEILQAKAL